jgi:hypothetical protein
MSVRVTDVIKRCGLVDTTYFDDTARDRGTAVHLACQYFDEGRLDWAALHESVFPYVEQYARFHRTVHPTITGIELTLEHEQYGLVGHCDRTMIIDENVCVVDLKTGGKAPWHGVQLAGYAMMLDPLHLRRVLYLSPTAWKLEPYNDRTDFDVFRAALVIERAKQKWNL